MKTLFRRPLGVVAASAMAASGFAQGDPAVVDRVIELGKKDSRVMKLLKGLTDIGPRLTGSTYLDRAQTWTMKQFEAAQGSLGSALGRLLAVSENYPQLRANDGFMGLQAELAGTENRISVERNRFNEAAASYNTAIRSVPAVFYASALGFQGKAYFKSTAAAAEPPKVQFNFGNKPAAPTTAAPAPAPVPAQPAPGK